MEALQTLSSPEPNFATIWGHLLATRYLALTGYIVLVWDSTLMLPRERQYIWSAPSSPLKWIYLVKKYTAILFLTFAMITEMSGMEGVIKSTTAWFPIAILLGTISIAVGDGIVLKRVCILWENRRSVYITLFMLWAAGTTAALCVSIFAISKFTPDVTFDRDLNTCVPSNHIRLVSSAWGIPLIFDAAVMIMTCWNALDRPRQITTRLTMTLTKDGIIYFLLIDALALRKVNTIIFLKVPLSMLLAGFYCSWALAVTFTSRLVINLRVVDVQNGADSLVRGRISPFDQTSSQTSSLDKIKIHREEEYEFM
ncbi:hypothetical protein SISSUDRAFT_1052115 [Sistotremastrum suecicum HHB10207 ss-3]|uniref:DUF6533 domain-containing protein n=1 Tax=Sistotremastrum suecicum HHB10207 ss-3 TaxID=1314776 RepID=A0A166A459_9AGAM|nr:hypothetical protein SISSUDRAFT_1052115 [Sistotremastrum suecicum HHB10207 ss-3]